MPIDQRSLLGQRLEVREPVALNLGQLGPEAGELVARAMADGEGRTREDAVINVLNRAARLMAEGVVHIDTAKLYDAHPDVQRAVNEEAATATSAGRTITTGKIITKLIVRGAARRTTQKPEEKEESLVDELANGVSDFLGGLGGLFGGGRKSA